MYEISSGFSWMFKYIFPYLMLAFFGIFFYTSIKDGDSIGQFFGGFGVVYILLMNFLVINKISAFVFVDKDTKSIVAYNSSNGKQKTGRWDELVRVYNFLNIYTVLKFNDGLKIRFRPKKYVPLLDEDDAKDIVDALKRLALKNSIR